MEFEGVGFKGNNRNKGEQKISLIGGIEAKIKNSKTAKGENSANEEGGKCEAETDCDLADSRAAEKEKISSSELKEKNFSAASCVECQDSEFWIDNYGAVRCWNCWPVENRNLIGQRYFFNDRGARYVIQTESDGSESWKASSSPEPA